MPAQTGCTDPQALNFNTTAIQNDGSCEYPFTSFFPADITRLPGDIPECSGMQFFNDQLWAINDSGDGPFLYQLDLPSRDFLRKVFVKNAANIDWEDLAQDSLHLYAGDFGNNNGNRRDLKIYKIKKSELNRDSVSSEKIEFTWEDQDDFSTRLRAHNFDCEAFFHYRDSLYLWSKNWLDGQTRLYVLPDIPGTYAARKIAQLDTKGMVAAADINPSGEIVVLLGYTTIGQTFFWTLFDFKEREFLSGNKRRFSFSNPTFAQAEAATFRDTFGGFFGSEAYLVFEPLMGTFDLSTWVKSDISLVELVENQFIKIYPNPFQSAFTIENDAAIEDFKIINALGLKMDEKANIPPGTHYFPMNNLPAGVYFLKGEIVGKTFRYKIQKH